MHWLLNSPGGFDALLIVAAVFGFILYILPTLLAWSLNSKGLILMLVLNLLFGWTILGWLAILIWALVSARNEEFEDIDHTSDN